MASPHLPAPAARANRRRCSRLVDDKKMAAIMTHIPFFRLITASP